MFEFIKNFFKKAEAKVEEKLPEVKAVEEKVVAEVKAAKKKVVAEATEVAAKVRKPRKPKAKS